jgi:predicted NBD/HSP70 family sugar kinase
LDADGKMASEPVRMETPYPCPPKVMIVALSELVNALRKFDRVSVGFPGVVREGKVITAPYFGNRIWRGYPLAEALQKKWRKPVRLLNDADMQGSAVIGGKGLELVVTLGSARLIRFKSGKNTKIVSNRAGLIGGIALWRHRHKGLCPRAGCRAGESHLSSPPERGR